MNEGVQTLDLEPAAPVRVNKRTDYGCPCSARDERYGANPPDTLKCWSCRQETMRQLPARPDISQDRI